MSTTKMQAAGVLRWQAEMPLLTSRFFLWDFVKVIGFSGAILYAILLTIVLVNGGWKQAGMVTAVTLMIMGGVGMLFVLISAVFFGNRWPVEFAILPQGLCWESKSRRGKAANRAAVVAGVLAGSAGTAGAGLLAEASESGALGWEEIRRLRSHPEQRVISVMNGWRVVTRLYCTAENFAAALALLEHYSGVKAEASETARPLTGRVPKAAVEIARRVALLACVAVGSWQMWDGPSVLVKAERVDFRADYARAFAPPEERPVGAIATGRALIRRLREPMTMEEYIASKTEQRRIAADGRQWAALWESLPKEGRWMRADDEALGGVLGAMQDIYRRTQWTAMYIAVDTAAGNDYVELRYENEPRESKAPMGLIYPHRGLGWMWIAAGALIYALLPRAQASLWMVGYDAVCVAGLDAMGVTMAAFFFNLSLWCGGKMGDVLGENFGLTMFLWAVAASGLAFVAWAARCASFAVMVEQGQLRFAGVTGTKVCPMTEIAAARYVKRGEALTELRIESRSGGSFAIPCGPMCRLERLPQGLGLAGITVTAPQD